MWSKILTLMSLLTASHCTQDTVERETKLGRVMGLQLDVLNKRIEQYQGIPYAEPPLGARRFRASIPLTTWNGTYNATSRRTACPQRGYSGISPTGINYTEDCLHLHVWTPHREQNQHVEPVPVLVWIHGGGFTHGTASNPNYNGSILCAKTGFVVVSMNYRLDILGFLDASSVEAPGNMGLMDQTLALEWDSRERQVLRWRSPQSDPIWRKCGGHERSCSYAITAQSIPIPECCLLSGSLYSIDFYDSPQQSLPDGSPCVKDCELL
ncbi:hypothetical protein HPB48_014898 [Haemaphysalis longicornis]|uniref:Carboxylesterase type B domain-containing protein n=1 Tax=Haemaphysalis longicornis TaxID=44386 RepID=A0A9J6GBJ4_HAELO|nr:hypothetical protein HPB48_014898 [Haemaphysalis longicornis]